MNTCRSPVKSAANTDALRASGQLAGRNVLFQQVGGILSSSSTSSCPSVYRFPPCMKRTKPRWHRVGTFKKKNKTVLIFSCYWVGLRLKKIPNPNMLCQLWKLVLLHGTTFVYTFLEFEKLFPLSTLDQSTLTVRYWGYFQTSPHNSCMETVSDWCRWPQRRHIQQQNDSVTSPWMGSVIFPITGQKKIVISRSILIHIYIEMNPDANEWNDMYMKQVPRRRQASPRGISKSIKHVNQMLSTISV